MSLSTSNFLNSLLCPFICKQTDSHIGTTTTTTTHKTLITQSNLFLQYCNYYFIFFSLAPTKGFQVCFVGFSLIQTFCAPPRLSINGKQILMGSLFCNLFTFLFLVSLSFFPSFSPNSLTLLSASQDFNSTIYFFTNSFFFFFSTSASWGFQKPQKAKHNLVLYQRGVPNTRNGGLNYTIFHPLPLSRGVNKPEATGVPNNLIPIRAQFS